MNRKTLKLLALTDRLCQEIDHNVASFIARRPFLTEIQEVPKFAVMTDAIAEEIVDSEYAIEELIKQVKSCL